MNIKEHINGLTIDHLLEIHDYIQIYFTNGDIMNLNNRYVCQPSDLSAFQGEVVIQISDTDQELVVKTGSGYSITMSMLAADVLGPEATEYYRYGSDGQIIIWEQVS
jgi:hypothetical protein